MPAFRLRCKVGPAGVTAFVYSHASHNNGPNSTSHVVTWPYSHFPESAGTSSILDFTGIAYGSLKSPEIMGFLCNIGDQILMLG